MSNTSAASVSAAQTESFEFTLNGEAVVVEGVRATTTLLDWLRATGRTGSKCGCAEGDCGACSVALVPMFAGREVVTVEGLAFGDKLHPVQSAMVEHYGSQCGYCTPGFVVSMFEGYYRDGVKTQPQLGGQLCGNLC